MRKIKYGFLGTALIIAAFAAVVLCRVGGNHIFAKMVNSGDYYILIESMEDEERYVEMEEDVLEVLPYDAYVMNYNLGNAHYKDGDYSKAQVYYEKCLEFELPEGEECCVRINLTMTKIQQIDFNTIDTGYEAFKNNEEVDLEALIEKIDEVIDQLKADREILTEKNCAGAEDANGHSQDAETLKTDIDNKIEELEKMKEEIQQKIDEQNQEQNQDQNQQDQNQQDQQDQSQDQQNQNNQDQNNQNQNQSEPDDVDDDREEEIREQMEEKESDAREEREETQQEAEEDRESQGYWDSYYGDGSPEESEERVW